MSRVDPDETHPRWNDEQRRADNKISPDEPSPGHTPSKAEGEERDVDEALQNEDRRS